MKRAIILVKNLKRMFNESKAHAIEEMKVAMSCSTNSIRNKLAQIGYYTSYTHNAKYYTLKEIPEFDDNGIWFYTCKNGYIGFTKYKTLNALIINIVETSENGMTEKEISLILKARTANQLVILARDSKVKRVKVGEIYYYLSANISGYKKQYNKLINSDAIMITPEETILKIDESILIKILLVVIEMFNIKLENIVNGLKRKKINISRQKVELVMMKYGLYEKKTL